jgi:hypothetical protein
MIVAGNSYPSDACLDDIGSHPERAYKMAKLLFTEDKCFPKM